MIEDTFALCFGGVEGGGALMLGAVDPPPGVKLLYTPLVPSVEHPHYYIVELNQIAMSGDPIQVPQVHCSRRTPTHLTSPAPCRAHSVHPAVHPSASHCLSGCSLA